MVPLLKSKKELKNVCSQEIQILFREISQKQACFQLDMAYGKSKDLAKRSQSDKALRDKAFKIAGDSKYDWYQRGIALMVYEFFDKKSNVDAKPNYQLANKLQW